MNSDPGKSGEEKQEAAPVSKPSPARKPARGFSRVRTFFNGFTLGIAVTAAAMWYFARQAREHPEAHQRYQQAAADATEATGEALFQASAALKAKMETLDLKPEQVQEELARSGQIVRRRAREIAGQVADAATDARITATLKARLAADSELSASNIPASTTEGRVTLDGTVSAAEHVEKAVALAMESSDVRDVTSKLKVENKAP